MGMSTHVLAFRAPDEKWEKMKTVWDSCEAAGIEPPGDVLEYFNHEAPDNSGVEIDISPILKDFQTDCQSGYSLRIKDIPSFVTELRFYNSW